MTSNETDTYFRKRGELSTFASSLKQAITDREEEQQYDVRFYYDAEVVVWIVLGFEFEASPSDLRDRLVHALLSTGYLGRVHVLRPHALEFFTVLRRQPEFRSPRTTERFQDRVRDYVKRRGVEQTIREIATAIRGIPEDKRLDILLRKFRQSGAETFATIALTDGYWQTRLKRLHDPQHKILRFDEGQNDLRDAVAHEDVWTFYRAIAAHRRVEKSINTLADATAMSLLSRQIKRFGTEPDVPRVRFYTTTTSLLAVQDDPDCASLLQYQHPTRGAESIFRSTNYYILRASFDALRFDSLKPLSDNDNGEAAITLGELSEVAEQVSRALKATEVADTAELNAVRLSRTDLMKRIEDIRVGNRDLSTVLEEIEQSAFLKRVLTDYEPPWAFRAILAEFAQVWDAFDTRTASVRLHATIRSEARALKDSLGGFVHELKQSFDFTRRVIDRVGNVVLDGRFPSNSDPMRDLGLVRWALHLTPDARSVLSDFIQALFVEGASTEAVIRACSDLVRRAESPEDEAMCSIIVGLLWTLGLFADVVTVIIRYQDFWRESGGKDFPPGLTIMRTAARLRAKDQFSRDEKETHLRILEQMVKSAALECRGRLYIGLGYTAFYLWYNDQPLGGRQRTEEDKAWETRWAGRSLEYGLEAMSLLENDPLGIAFAVNHCAFTTITTGLKREDAEKYLDALTNFRDDDAVWNYRFADTIATSYLSTAKAAWGTARDLVPQSHQRATQESKACSALYRAENILIESRPYFGDSEVQKTLLRVRTLQDEVGCARADR